MSSHRDKQGDRNQEKRRERNELQPDAVEHHRLSLGFGGAAEGKVYKQVGSHKQPGQAEHCLKSGEIAVRLPRAIFQWTAI
ncbi:hypothetical protein CLOSTMETH_03611 [[Clostridium] methylpentosum DSM 5476]|uniref:Uncharacterized protein n=1 Tax=[Clostridium] methylpentosum DSM 5476 TaxID=537013 RepID=C0EIB6_9FIRM|nr:hypothetical protein CLOSTMETH_03611 [[Clostridium] methylpentosum DSM 5476]